VSTPLIVMDVGDVLIPTRPAAQWRALGRRCGLPWRAVADAAEASGIVRAIEAGRTSDQEFFAAMRSVLGRPELSDLEIRRSWNAILTDAEPTMAAVARRCAEAGRLLLASNTNSLHWPEVRRRLRGAGVSAPAVLSFEIGHCKPSAAFYEALAAADPRVPHNAIYIDDRSDNVAAAARFGMAGWRHRDPAMTGRRLSDLLSR